jgi:sodium transport system permease protein
MAMLFKIYKKEIIDSFRDRRTLLLTVFLPILMMTALTFYYESMIAGDEGEILTLAVEETLTSEQETILTTLENVELLEVEDPEKAHLDGEAHAAVLFAADFHEQVQDGGVGHVEIIGDTLSQNSSNLIFQVSTLLSEYERIVAIERLQEANVDPSITEVVMAQQRETSSEDSNIMVLTILIPLILTIAIGVGAGPTAADLFAGEKERKTMESLLMTPVSRPTLLLAKFLTISSVGIIIGIITLAVVAVEIFFFTEHLKAAISFGDQTLQVFIAGILVVIVFSFFIGSFLMITSIIGKTIKEAQSYSTPVVMLTIFPLMMVMELGVNELTIQHFLLPIVNIVAIITELLFGIVNYEHVLAMLGSNTIYTIIVYLISHYLFLKDKWAID